MSKLEQISYPFLSQKLYKRHMDNGMVVYYIPKKGYKELTAILSVGFGSIDAIFTKNGEKFEYPEGLAHFLEHQVFEIDGDKDASQQFTKMGSESNAFTTFERTSYYFSTTEDIQRPLELLLNFTTNLQIGQSGVNKEKGIIEQEISMYLDDPDSRLYSGVLANLYPGTPLSTDIAGTAESINLVTEEMLRDHFNTFYRPDFKTVIIVGDFDIKEVDRQVRKKETRRRKTLPDIKREKILMLPVIEKSSIRMDVSSSKIAVGFRSSLSNRYSLLEQKIGMRLFMAMLFGWTSARYQNWYDVGKIDDSFDIEIEISEFYCFIVITADTDSPIALGTQIRKSLRNFSDNTDISVAHLNLIKNDIYGEFIRSLDNVEELAHQFLQYQDHQYTYFDFPELLQELNFNRVLAIGKEFFANSEQTEFIIFPK